MYNVSIDFVKKCAFQFTSSLNINLNSLSLCSINSLKTPPGEIKMKHQGYNCEFKGEMINNELDKSAHDVIDCQKDKALTQSSLKSYLAAPYYKMTYSKLEPEEDPHSCASKF